MAQTTTTLDIDVSEAKAKLEELSAMAAALHEQIGAAVDIKRLIFKPGDTIVVRVDSHLPADSMGRLQQHVQMTLGVDVKVLVLDKGIALDVLTSEAA